MKNAESYANDSSLGYGDIFILVVTFTFSINATMKK